ncbi:hypothetical protein C2845_PM04G33740 [Panicum miliaceum]|uniref:Uncharacterized protein n=1 Tax=Panicum miliaceum TaxID=4540 RepID=A0A3L6QNV8_PANMI|nr:hypothetical protein C2845_PM04G33740 [Panicum miliaceum]
MAHPGGPLTTNKAAALAKFLERKLQQPDGLDSLNPDLVKLAVKNAKETIKASEASTSGRVVQHVSSFEDGSEDSEDEAEAKGIKRKRKNKASAAGSGASSSSGECSAPAAVDRADGTLLMDRNGHDFLFASSDDNSGYLSSVVPESCLRPRSSAAAVEDLRRYSDADAYGMGMGLREDVDDLAQMVAGFWGGSGGDADQLCGFPSGGGDMVASSQGSDGYSPLSFRSH